MAPQDFLQAIIDSVSLPFDYFINSQKRVYYVYLFSSLLLAYYVFRKSKVYYSFFKYILNKKIWLSSSSFVDYKFLFFNSFVKVFLIAPYLMMSMYLSMEVEGLLISKFGYSSINLSKTETLIYYTIAFFVLNDLLSYIVHYLFHKIPLLWEFHKIHHSATVMSPITQYRLHPVELLVNNCKYIILFGLLSGCFEYFSAGVVSKYTFLEVNVLSFLFLFFGSNLRHSHVRLTYLNFIEFIFISPFQHQIHHSDNPKHFNKNMGSKLALWDWLFGTLKRSRSVGKIRFGLGGVENYYYDSFLKNLLQPFKNIYRTIFLSSRKK